MEEEIDLKELMKLLWRKKIIIIVITLIFALVAFIKFGILDKPQIQDTPDYYYAKSTFIVDTTQVNLTGLEEILENKNVSVSLGQSIQHALISDSFVLTCNELAKSKTILDDIIQKLNLDIDSDTLSSLISVSNVSKSNLLAIIVAYSNQEIALQISNELTNKLISSISEIYSVKNISIVDSPYILDDFKILESENNLLNISTPESISTNYIKKAQKYILISVFIGIALSVGIILVLEMFDETIKTEKDLKTKPLAIINKNNIKNDFYILTTKLSGIKNILISSESKNDDISYIAKKLSIVFAQSGKKTLLIDLSSKQHNLIKNYQNIGLSDYINNKTKNKSINKYLFPSTVENMDILTAGSDENLQFDETQLKELLSTLEEKYDHIIIDSKNTLEDLNTLKLIKILENIIFVVTLRKTNLNKFNEANDLIKDLDKNILGNIVVEK